MIRLKGAEWEATNHFSTLNLWQHTAVRDARTTDAEVVGREGIAEQQTLVYDDRRTPNGLVQRQWSAP